MTTTMYRNTFPRYYGSDPLLEAKNSLRLAEKTLIDEKTVADDNITSLKIELAASQHTLDAANKRLETVKLVTNAICQNCFDVLPALGKNFDEEVLKTCQRESKCACCGYSLFKLLTSPGGIIKMPPCGQNSSLKMAELARRKAEHAIANPQPQPPVSYGNSTNRRIFPLTQSHLEPTFLRRPNAPLSTAENKRKHQLPFPSRPHHTSTVRRTVSPPTSLDRMPSKQSFVAAASKSVRDGGRQVNDLSTALMAWVQHVNQQKEELQKVQAMLLGIQAQMETRNINMEEVSSEQCHICCDRQEQVAFQCGHRCCRQCAWDLNTCPMCRAVISQRFELWFE